MMPLPHRNTIKFFGMGEKKDYLLWHQSHGTFTALNKKFKVQMWSTVTGKILQSQEADLDEEAKKKKEGLKITYMRRKSVFVPRTPKKAVSRQYSVYQAGINDQTYTKDWNMTNTRSFSLIISDD